MEINCLCCGHNVDLDEAYDDYEGPVKCFACGALLEIRTEEGKVKSVRPVEVASAAHTPVKAEWRRDDSPERDDRGRATVSHARASEQ